MRSLERSADTYPWTYDYGEDRYESGDEVGDDEEEGEMRLREIWDDEVEREEEEGGGEEGTLRNEGDSSSDEGGDDNLGGDTSDEDDVECILEERGRGDAVEVKVRWVEGGEVTWEPVEAVRDCEAYGKFLRDRNRGMRWNREDAKPLEGRQGAWAGAKGPDLEKEHLDPLRGALKAAACSVARGRWVDTGKISAQEAERRWCNEPMPSAHEDDSWWPAALVLAGIEPAITSAMRAASDIALPSSSTDEVGNGRRKSGATKADEVRLEEQIKRSRLLTKIVQRWNHMVWEGRERDREGEDENILGGGERGERAGRMGAESRREREQEAARAKQEGTGLCCVAKFCLLRRRRGTPRTRRRGRRRRWPSQRAVGSSTARRGTA